MITLHQFARIWDIPNVSPFCSKVETLARSVSPVPVPEARVALRQFVDLQHQRDVLGSA